MTELLRAKYHNHWYKDEPLRGSGYRAISNEYSLDPILDKAARAVSHSLPKVSYVVIQFLFLFLFLFLLHARINFFIFYVLCLNV